MAIHHEDPPAYEDLEDLRADSAEYWRNTDIEENEASTPPEGEVIGRPVIKVAECFVGGDIQGLVDGCRALGISPGEKIFGPGNVYEWVKQVRRTSRTGGWVDVGSGHSRSSKQSQLDSILMDFPTDFSMVHLRAYAPTQSIVVLVGTFVLCPGVANALDDELRTNRYLRLHKKGQFTQFSTAVHRKSDALRTERTRVIESASTWLAQTFAGTLSSDFPGSDLPSIEFLTTRMHQPFTESDAKPAGRPGRSHYTDLLSIGSPFEVWVSSEIPGWRLGLPWRSDDAQWRIVAACRSTMTDDELHNDVETPKPAPHEWYHLDDYFDGLLIRLTAIYLLVQYEHAFGDLRDRLATADSEQTALQTLDTAHRTLTTLSFDASLVANELKRWAADDYRWPADCIEPYREDPWDLDPDPTRKPEKLLETFQVNMTERADWLLDLEPRIRDQLVSRASVLAAGADLRLQRIVLSVSLLALVIALLSLVRQ